ncbi:hypothetical protein [Paraburkholderia caledonica]|uniref:hypothetical protein n=1 Tax=Paraburkholderia caledonica TaxID=134536 RepID=UPI000B4903B5|nr:hypothetical protein BWU74_19415 [Burkholderia sp. Bk]
MKIATGGVGRTVLIAACFAGFSGMACAQSGSAGAGVGVGVDGLSATPSGGSVNGGGAAGTTLAPTPGLATPGGTAGTGRIGVMGAGAGRVPNNMRANGTSLNQNPDPRVPSLSGRPPAPR